MSDQLEFFPEENANLSFIARLKRLLLGVPLTDLMSSHEKIPKWKALAILSSDALSSVAYATEEILIPLAGFSLAATYWSLWIALAIGLLLVILTISYRQTIDAYPGGGGAYTVAKENLGVFLGLIAAGSLLTDYVLTVAVSVASGIDNLASAFPILKAHQVSLGLLIILIIALMNLRGVKDSASLFALPTYFFIFSIFSLIIVGFVKYFFYPETLVIPLEKHRIVLNPPAIPIFLLLRAFSSGCSALTGVEAISNGIPLFKSPTQKNAKATLTWMSFLLGFMFLGMTFLARMVQIIPKSGETAISLLAKAIFGDNFFYYLLQTSTMLILLLAANTSYADFPRLSSLLAKDRFLPRQLAILGDRLVFSNGIIGLSVLAAALLILFHGKTHLLIPLYSIGVFLSFSLSQFGMVIHHLKKREKNYLWGCFFNLTGAITTFTILLVVAITKFEMGAWIVLLFIPLLVHIFYHIHRHYIAVGKELSLLSVNEPHVLKPISHAVLLPISGFHKGVLDALRYSISISSDVRAVYVELNPDHMERVQAQWQTWAPEIPFVSLKSPFRSVLTPLLNYIEDIEKTENVEMITVVIPEFITKKWYHQFLHNQTAFLFRTALLFRPKKVVTSVRYHLKST